MSKQTKADKALTKAYSEAIAEAIKAFDKLKEKTE